ncbi:MAG: hypothetical protein RLZZ396_778 [Planctomycetota bacterium]|jgi:hypothetical protein
MNTKLDTQAAPLKSRSRGTSRDMSPDAVSRRLDIVDELREFARELLDSTRHGPIGKPYINSTTSDSQHQNPLH